MIETPNNDNKSDYNDKEAKASTVAFVKIVERHPEIYIRSHNVFDRAQIEEVWRKIFEEVKTEMKVTCTLNEIKTKWKGIRSAFRRYQVKCSDCEKSGTRLPRKYYLAEHLEFLLPHLRPRGAFGAHPFEKLLQTSYVENSDDEDGDISEAEVALPNWTHISEVDIIKSDSEDNTDENPTQSCSGYIPRAAEPSSEIIQPGHSESKENEDLLFFKCILPDLADFTPQQKRKFKIGVIQLIDDIANEK